MKKFLFVLLGLALVLATFGTTGCGGAKSPESVVSAFYNYLNQGEFSKAADLTTEPSYRLELLGERFGGVGEYIRMSNLTLNTIGQAGDQAEVKAAYDVSSSVGSSHRIYDVYLKKVGDVWHIDNIYDSILW